MVDLLEEIKLEERRCKPLTDRQDADMGLIDMLESLWVLRDASDEKRRVRNSIYVPLNDVKVYVATVEAFLQEAAETIEVTSEDENLDTAEIESFIKAMWTAIDDRASQGIGTGGKKMTFSPFTFQQTTRRGWTSHLCYFRFEKGELVPDVHFWDSRYVRTMADDKGLAWASYLTTRPARQVKVDYPDVKLASEKELVSVRNVWTREENIVYVEDVEGMREPHDLKYVPGVFQTVPLGSMSMDPNSIRSEGESLLLMVRDIFPELVRLASIAQTLNMYEMFHALQEKVAPEEMDGTPPPEHELITDPNSVTKTTGGFTEIPIGQLRQQAFDLADRLELRMQRGGLSNFDSGVGPAMSGVALLTIGQGRKRVYGPRLVTHGLAKKNITLMAIKQILHEAKKYGIRQVKLGRQTYDLAVLKEEFDLDFKYKITDATIEAAKQSMAVAQKGMRPLKTILRYTLQVDDPDGEIRDLRIEQAAALFPQFAMYDTLKALAEAAEKGDEDAEIKLNMGLGQLGISLDQLYAGQIPATPAPREEKPGEQFVDLFKTNEMTKGRV